MDDFKPAYAGNTQPISSQSVVGRSSADRADVYVPGTEDLETGELRVTILGSGNPWVTKAQAAGSVLIEVGNIERDVLVFDLGSGSLANFSGLQVPVTSVNKVFFSHLHADHIADYVTLMGSYVKAGRIDPVEVWGGASDVPERGTAAFVDAIQKALAWDFASVAGLLPQASTGSMALATEVPYDRSEVIYERNGVAITSFPVIHGLNGAVGFRIDYAGQSVVFSGDTLPSKTVVEAAAGCDLLIHETFLPAETLSEAMNLPIEQARIVSEKGHTTAAAAGVIFDMTSPRMAAMWHCLVVDGYIEPVFTDVQRTFDGAATLCQDLTVFNVTADSVTARQATINPVEQALRGESHTTPRMDERDPAPSWWAQAALDWRAELRD